MYDPEAAAAWRDAWAEVARCDEGLAYADDPDWTLYWIFRRRAAEHRCRALLRALRAGRASDATPDVR